MKKKVFNPGRHGMVSCRYCNSTGYIHYPKRQCCPKCGGFGFIKKETEKDANTSPRSGKCEGKDNGEERNRN